MRSYDESTQVGFRIRGIEPPDLASYPDSTKRLFWQFVVDLAIPRKRRETMAGLDKDGEPLRPLKPKSIKYRKSEVGPTDPHGPPLQPSWSRSRVNSLLTGRAHVNSAELFWAFDAVTGKSFAYVLRAQREQGRDVFGLSDAGIAWVKSAAWARWEAWKRGIHPQLPPIKPTLGVTVAKVSPRKLVPRIPLVGRIDLEEMTLGGQEGLIKRAIAAGQFTGFRRLNLRGEIWKPGAGVGQVTPRAEVPRYHVVRPVREVLPPAVPKPRPTAVKPPIPEPVKPPKPTPEPAHLEYGPSSATVEYARGQQAEVDVAIASMFPGKSLQDMASLVGAMDDWTVTVGSTGGDRLYISSKHPKIDYHERTIRKLPDGSIEISNALFFVKEAYRGEGIGAKVLGRQIEQASKAGVSHLRTHGVRDRSNPSPGQGYNVWPLFGYDGPIEMRGTTAPLPAQFATATKYSDIMPYPEGQQWWQEHGQDCYVKFDLTPGSYSMQTFELYIRKKAASRRPIP